MLARASASSSSWWAAANEKKRRRKRIKKEERQLTSNEGKIEVWRTREETSVSRESPKEEEMKKRASLTFI